MNDIEDDVTEEETPDATLSMCEITLIFFKCHPRKMVKKSTRTKLISNRNSFCLLTLVTHGV